MSDLGLTHIALPTSNLEASIAFYAEYARMQVVHRRTEQGFVREVYEGLDALLPLAEVDIELPLAEIYDGVEFLPEPEEDEV